MGTNSDKEKRYMRVRAAIGRCCGSESHRCYTGEVLGIHQLVLKLAAKQTAGQTAVARKTKGLASRK